MVTFVTKGQDTETAPKNLRFSKHTVITIHWKAISEGMPLVFRFNVFGRKMHFLKFSQNNLSP
jgi:hypothetical protein